MKNVMDERMLRQRLRRGILVCSLVGILILVSGISTLNVLETSLNAIVFEQMESETNEYKQRILRQMDKDFQTLETLAAVFAYDHIPESGWFDQCLIDANKGNGFVSMSYFGQDGYGKMTYYAYGIKSNVHYTSLNEAVVPEIEAALSGERRVSSLFKSSMAPELVFAYSVPVYDKKTKEIVGALSAASNVDTFVEIIENDSVMAGKHAIHLVNDEGQMLLSATVRHKADRPDDFFHSSLFAEGEQEKIDQALKTETSLFTKMVENRESYHVFLNPVGVNGWYLVYVNSEEEVNHVAYKMVNITGGTCLLLLVVIVLLLIHTCKVMIANNRQLVSLAYTDYLTGADNILRFNQKLQTARTRKDGFCLVAINIRQFKFINEIFGEKAADRFLCNIRESIEAFLHSGEFFCRESGDLFYLYLKETDKEVIRSRFSRLVDEVCGAQLSGQMDYQIMIYAGALVWDPGWEKQNISNEMLITRLRFAMQFSKRLPANQINFYDTEIHKSAEMENYVEAHMHQALHRGEFRLYLQPKMNLSTGKLGGAEALVRWVTDEGKMIYPDSFIPQFERNGFCVQLDMYMVERACVQIRRWMDSGVEPVPISVNQSKLLFFDAGYLEYLQMITERYQVPTNLIVLEILEGLALEHADEMNTKLRSIRNMGFRVSMDDFGSGYSSFNTLGNLEIDELKLDRAFLMEATATKENRFCTIIEHIVKLTRSLQIVTVAEGVETLENEQMIRKLGCDYGQGYYYSRPISADDFTAKYMEA